MEDEDNMVSFQSGSTKSSLGMSGDARKQIANDLLNSRDKRQGRQDR
jgi:hypothetical protein